MRPNREMPNQNRPKRIAVAQTNVSVHELLETSRFTSFRWTLHFLIDHVCSPRGALGLGFRVGFRVQGWGFRVEGHGFGSGLGSRFGVQGLGLGKGLHRHHRIDAMLNKYRFPLWSCLVANRCS